LKSSLFSFKFTLNFELAIHDFKQIAMKWN
jgi:hypothetical protein